jgi:hypothetical protein
MSRPGPSAVGTRAAAVLLGCIGVALSLGVVARSAAPRPEPSFAAAKYYAIAKGGEVALADLNGDRKPDLATPNTRGSTISVLLNRGDGRFGARAGYGTAPHPGVVDAADLNGDGKADLLSENSGRSLSVLLNRGDGRFEPNRDYPTKESFPYLAIGDLNRDGKPELVVSNNEASTFSIFLNHGDGTFAPRRDYATGQKPSRIAIADLNGDGSPDLVHESLNAVSVLLNDGNGGFGARHDYKAKAGYWPLPVVVVDLNGDRKLDLVSSSGAGESSVLLNRGDASFTVRDVGYGNVLAVADLNGDQRPDVVTEVWDATAEGWSVSVDVNKGDGSFPTGRNYSLGDNPTAGTVADLNGDGRPELIVTRNEGVKSGPYGPVLSVHLNRGDGRFQPRVDYPTRGVAGVQGADLNGDGKPELVTTGTTTVSVLMNRPGRCNVQWVWDMKLAPARQRLARAGCRVGRIRYVHRNYQRGRVIAQTPDFGVVLRKGGKVNLVVNRGPR